MIHLIKSVLEGTLIKDDEIENVENFIEFIYEYKITRGFLKTT